MIPVTFSLSCWNLTSKVLLLRMEFCLVTNMTPLPLLGVSLALTPDLTPTFQIAYSLFTLLPSNLVPSLSVTFHLLFPCINGSSFPCLSAPWSRLSSLPGYLMYYFSLQGLRVEMKYGGQASTGVLIFCVITSG